MVADALASATDLTAPVETPVATEFLSNVHWQHTGIGRARKATQQARETAYPVRSG